MEYLDDDIVDAGEYSPEDRLILINVDRVPEVLTILAEDKIPCFDTNLRINQDFIHFARKYHYNLLRVNNIIIQKLPKYFNWEIVETNHREELILKFPWEELARAYVQRDESNLIREAVENGIITL